MLVLKKRGRGLVPVIDGGENEIGRTCGSTKVTQKFAPQVELSGSNDRAKVPDGPGLRSGSPLTFTCGTTTAFWAEAPLDVASAGFAGEVSCGAAGATVGVGGCAV